MGSGTSPEGSRAGHRCRALGNEVIKNLVLLGIGHLLVVDMDRIEQSNLSRSVLFRAEHEGSFKAVAAVQAARGLYPEIHAEALVGNVLAEVGLGCFRWAQIVVGALDNREARVFVNSACAQVQRPWIDGAIDVLNGVVRGFAPPATACYECTMGQVDWEILAKRRSCTLLARQALAEGGTPTTSTTASVIGAIQAQEVVKRLHGLESLNGRGFVFEGLHHHSYTVEYPIAPDCPWHGQSCSVQAFNEFGADTQLAEIWQEAAKALPGLVAFDLSREIVLSLVCPRCRNSQTVRKPIELVKSEMALCPECRGESAPEFCHSLGAGSPLLELTPAQLGLPRWDILWARSSERMLGMELAKDSMAFAGN